MQIVEFVAKVTTEGSLDFLPPAKRIGLPQHGNKTEQGRRNEGGRYTMSERDPAA